MKVLHLLAALVFWAGSTESGFARISCHMPRSAKRFTTLL
jgi:hypothetical protein